MIVGSLQLDFFFFFYSFLRAGELTISSDSCFDSSSHLAWGDVGVDDPTALTVLNIKLMAFKTATFLFRMMIYLM